MNAPLSSHGLSLMLAPVSNIHSVQMTYQLRCHVPSKTPSASVQSVV